MYGEQQGKSLYDHYSEEWGGSCFGFSVTSTKFYNGNLNTGSYGGSDTYYIPTPRSATSAVTRLINAAQISWWLPGVASVNFNCASLIAACENFANTGTNPIIFYIDGTAGYYTYCHAVVPWRVEQSGNDVRIYVYDNNQPGNESIYFTAHANGTYSCNYTYLGNKINIKRLGFQTLQQVLDGESTASRSPASGIKLMLISVDSNSADILSADGRSVENLTGAQKIERIPTGQTGDAQYTEYWLPVGEYKVVAHENDTVSVLVANDSETYRLLLMPDENEVVVDVGNTVEVVSASHGNITSYMDDGSTQILPATSASGSLTPPSSPAELSTFRDVPSESWFSEAVTSISTVGIMDGVGGGEYDPQGELTVGMLVTILMRMQHGHLNSTGTWYDAYVEAAIRDHILSESDGLSPDDVITRAQAALLLTRYIERYNPKWAKTRTSSEPTDISSVPIQYRSVVEKAFAWNLLHGDPDGRFNPNNSLSRAEAVQMIYNYYTTVD